MSSRPRPTRPTPLTQATPATRAPPELHPARGPWFGLGLSAQSIAAYSARLTTNANSLDVRSQQQSDELNAARVC